MRKRNPLSIAKSGVIDWSPPPANTHSRIHPHFALKPLWNNRKAPACPHTIWAEQSGMGTQVEGRQVGAAVELKKGRSCTLAKLNRVLIPLAPFKEQKRIVAKVDQLIALCDELKAGLVQAQTDGGKLMEAFVHHVLAG